MFDDLKQFVPSDYCHACRGCCVFHEADGIWGPHLLTVDVPGLLQAAPREALSSDHRHILTCPAGSRHRCRLLGSEDHRCGSYLQRPFECRLYPFLISSEGERLRLYIHLACPYAGERVYSPEGRVYVTYLREYLFRPEIRRVLLANKDVLADYSPFSDQLEPCFDLSGQDLLSQKRTISRWLSCRRQVLSTSSFTSLFAWQGFFSFLWEEIDGNLCVFAEQPVGIFSYWPPLGKTMSCAAVEKCFARMQARNKGGGMSRMENVSVHEAFLFDRARYDVKLQGHEYIYYRQDIAALRGDDYKSKRHDINQLERRHKLGYRPFEARDIQACSQLFDRWLDKRRRQHEDDTYRHMLDESRSVHGLLLENAEALGLLGRVVTVDGRIAGYTFGHALSEDVFCDLVEIADPDVPGLAAYIFHELCADEDLKSFMFINAMDDFGMPNVSRGKMSYRPAFLEPRYSVTERQDV